MFKKTSFRGLLSINMTTKQIGNLGETLASQYLIKNGYKILEKNIKLSNLEIDIITFKNKRHTFFEVKTRQQININDNYLTLNSIPKLN